MSGFNAKRFLMKLARAKQANAKLGAASAAPAPLVQQPAPQTQQPGYLVQFQAPHGSHELGTSSEVKRVAIPTGGGAVGKARKDVTGHLRGVDETYALINTQLGGETKNIAYARIKYNPQIHQLEYQVVEPQLTEYLKKVVERTKEELHEKLDIDLSQLRARSQVYEYINSKIDEIWSLIGLALNPEDTLTAKYYVMRDTIGLNEIEALMQDPNIEDIGCDGVGLPIFVFHRNPLYGDIETNIKYDTKEGLDGFVLKLAQKCGRTVSVATPLMEGTLEDGSRVQITYGTDIARKGSNFTIRKFFKVPLTPIDLMNFGTIDATALGYLWLAIEKEYSILISGTTATGKTTLLNAISIFIPPASKIVSIEDTAELRLTHTNWVPQITRAGFGSDQYGEISMYTLLKSALRQRPDYLIVGEVRGVEASVLFQAMATGHPSLATLHADNISAVIHRLTTRPIDLPLALLENLDIIIFLEKAKKEGKFTRRVGKVIEIEGFDYRKDQLLTNDVFSWVPAEDKFTTKESSILLNIAEKLGWSEQDVQEEINRRAGILNWMKEKGIYKFHDVAKIIQMYYVDPRQLEQLMGE